MSTVIRNTQIDVKGDDVLDLFKNTIIQTLTSLPEEKPEIFYAKLSIWAAGMANPKHLEGPTRTEAIRGFFRGMKRKK